MWHLYFFPEEQLVRHLLKKIDFTKSFYKNVPLETTKQLSHLVETVSYLHIYPLLSPSRVLYRPFMVTPKYRNIFSRLRNKLFVLKQTIFRMYKFVLCVVIDANVLILFCTAMTTEAGSQRYKRLEFVFTFLSSSL